MRTRRIRGWLRRAWHFFASAGERRTVALPAARLGNVLRQPLPKPTPANLRRFSETPVARKAINMRKTLALLCVLCGEAHASLVFGAATSNRVTVTVVSGIGSSAFTVMVWAKPTTQTVNRRLWSLNDSGTNRGQATWQSVDANDFEFFINRVTTNAILNTNVNFSNNKNYFFAFTYDETDGPRMFYRDLDTANSTVTEATYASRTVGTGATQTVVDDVIIGNRNAASFNVAWQGTISTFIWHNARLTQAELNVWVERPQPVAGTTKLFMELGWAGTGTQGDLSGNGNNGTVTGATVSNHVAKARYP